MTSVKVFQSYIKTPFLTLLFVEVAIYFSSIYAAAFLRLYSEPETLQEILPGLWMQATLVALVTPIAMLATGLYQGQIREGVAGILLRLFISTLASAVLVSLVFYLLPGLLLGRGILGFAYMLAFFVVGTMRAIFFETADAKIFKKKILVYGAGETASHIESKLRRKSDRRGFDITGYILLDGQEQVIDDAKLVSAESSLLDYVRSERVDEIVVATSDLSRNIAVDDLVACKLDGILVSDILSFFEREAGQVRIDILEPSWLVTSEGFHQSLAKSALKRAFDVSASLVLLVVALPAMAMTTLAIWIEDGFRAPVLYSQVRVGRRGAHYRVYKFRSMRVDAEREGEAVWARHGDDRITRVGAFIRKTRVDELPQLFNVVNGTMSFVGPRPERPEFVDRLRVAIPYYDERHTVKPGVTGWAQLLYPYGSSVGDAYQKQIFDMYYVKNHSLFLDLLILLQTVEVVLFGKGAR